MQLGVFPLTSHIIMNYTSWSPKYFGTNRTWTEYLCNHVTMEIEVRYVNTRSHDMNVYVPFPRNELAKKSFYYSAAQNLNSLSAKVNKELGTLECFKRCLKRDIQYGSFQSITPLEEGRITHSFSLSHLWTPSESLPTFHYF